MIMYYLACLTAGSEAVMLMKNQSGILSVLYTENRDVFGSHLENRILFCLAIIFRALFERRPGI